MSRVSECGLAGEDSSNTLNEATQALRIAMVAQPESSPPPPTGVIGIQRTGLIEQFQRGGALPGHDHRVVEWGTRVAPLSFSMAAAMASRLSVNRL